MHVQKSKILLQSDKCLVMQPELIKIVGKSAALLLQQIHYWIENKHIQGKIYQEKKWIVNSYDAWASDLKIISKSTIGRCISILKKLELIFVETLSDFKSNRTNWYTINYNRISEILDIPSPYNSIKNNVDFETVSYQKPINQQVKMNVCSTQNESMYIDKKTNKDYLINQIKSDYSKSVIKEKKESEKPLTQQMINIWNEVINPEIKSQLTKNRAKFLIAALKYKFDNSILKWKNYCYQISSSNYLMGKINKGFKIALDTILKFDFIQRIFEKQFGIKDLKIKTESNDDIIQEIENYKLPYEIKEIHKVIYKKLDFAKYKNWFKDTEIFKSSTSIDIFVENKFNKNWIENNYKSDLQSLLNIKIRIFLKKNSSVLSIEERIKKL